MKKLFSFALLLGAAFAPVYSHAQCSVGSGVTFCSPTGGATTGTSFQVSAVGASNIATLMLYVDGHDPAAFTVHSNSLNTTLNLSAGSHNLVVNGWDGPGNVYQKSINISVSSSGATPSPAPSSCNPLSTGVRVCWPSSGSSTASPVQIVAGATASAGIAAMKIYVDDQDRYTVNSNSINTALSMSSGGHYVVVQAWDNQGNVYKTPVNVSVSGNATPAPTPTPTPAPPSGGNGSAAPIPSGAIVMSNVQNQNGWQTCGGCGNEGGSGSGPSYGISQFVSSPSLSGKSAAFYVNGGPAWSGAYWFIEQPVVPRPVTYLRYEFDLYVPSSASGVIQAIEFECQQNANKYTYNFAWQADYGSNTWRVFNYNSKSWESSGIPLQRFSTNTWHHIIAIYHASGNSVVHDSLTVDGVTKNVNIWHNATYTGNGLELTNAFQLDLNQSGSGYKVYVDNMKVALTN